MILSSHTRVPQRRILPEKIKKAQSLRNAGTQGRYNTAGIPDLLGSISNIASGGAQVSTDAGALYISERGSNAVEPSGNIYGNTFQLEMKASRYSQTYGSSDTVMPASADLLFGLYLGRPAEI